MIPSRTNYRLYMKYSFEYSEICTDARQKIRNSSFFAITFIFFLSESAEIWLECIFTVYFYWRSENSAVGAILHILWALIWILPFWRKIRKIKNIFLCCKNDVFTKSAYIISGKFTSIFNRATIGLNHNCNMSQHHCLSNFGSAHSWPLPNMLQSQPSARSLCSECNDGLGVSQYPINSQ